MKQCPECNRVYDDETLKFCLDDGAALVYGPAEPKTAILHSEDIPSERRTRLFDPRDTAGKPSRSKFAEPDKVALPNVDRKSNRMIAGVTGVILLAVVGAGAYWLYGDRPRKQIESIAVMPFVNETEMPIWNIYRTA
jgi:hypothetical protein